MELFILRHGHAESEAASDKVRELSPAGELEVKRMLQSYGEALNNVGQLLVSPYVRAQQTAKIVNESIDQANLQTCDFLVPSASPLGAIEKVGEMIEKAGSPVYMLIGHQPLLGVLLDQLCGLEPGKHRLATASLASIEFDVFARGCCDLRWVHHVS